MGKSNDISLSIVIPLYNNERQIQRAIDSVLNQSWKSFELIIVNDGSTDNSVSIVKKYDDNRIRIIQQINAGPASARNRGIIESKGNLIAFLDADDEWKLNHLEKALSVLTQFKDLKWYAAGYERRAENGKLLRRLIYPGFLKDKQYIEDFLDAYGRYGFICTCTTVIKKEVFECVGLFNDNKRHGEDTEMWIRIALKYPKIGYSKQISAINWVNEESLTMKECRLTSEISLKAINEIEHMVEQMDRSESQLIQPYIRRALKKLINLSIKEKNFSVLNEIQATYGFILDKKSLMKISLLKIVPHWIIDIAIRLRGLIVKW